jgi:hypothetical protein
MDLGVPLEPVLWSTIEAFTHSPLEILECKVRSCFKVKALAVLEDPC